jgi:hypothetical protein
MKRTRFVAVATVAISAVAGTAAVRAQMAAPTAAQLDITVLAGKWDGWWIGGDSFPLEVTINADGTYVSRVGADSGWGTFRVENGVIVAEGHLSGGDAPRADRTATATLVQRTEQRC